MNAAYLRLMEGAASDVVAAEYGIDEATLAEWVEWVSATAPSAAAASPKKPESRRPNRESIRAAAAVLLNERPVLRVGYSEDPDVPGDDLQVWFSDLAAHDFAFLVSRTLDVIATYPGVVAA